MAIWSNIADPEKRMERARRKLFEDRNAQFWGVLGLTMGIVADATKAPGTMATDAVNIYYDPAYVMTLTEDECKAVIAHEISHPALDHFRRQGDRSTETWNIAADYELNLDLDKAGLKMPDGALLDYRFDGMSAEQIHSVIERENSEDERQGNQPRHQPQSGNMLEPENDQTGQPMSGAEKADLADKWQEKTAQALGAARKAGTFGSGHVPTHLEAVTETVRAPAVIDWRQPLRAFIDRLGSIQTSWSKLSRRAIGQGMILPGHKVIRPSVVGCGVDVSGSMDIGKVRQAAAEVQAMLDDKACDAVEIIYFDTVIKAIDRYEIGETIVIKNATGGGTSFVDCVAYANEQEYAALIMLTDGQPQSGHWGDEPSCPVLWAITDSQKATDALPIPYGERLCLYTS